MGEVPLYEACDGGWLRVVCVNTGVSNKKPSCQENSWPRTGQKHASTPFTGATRLQENRHQENGPNVTPVFFIVKNIGPTGFALRVLNLRKRRTDRILCIQEETNGLVSLPSPEHG